MMRALRIFGPILARQWAQWRAHLTEPSMGSGDAASGLLDWMLIWTRPPWRRL